MGTGRHSENEIWHQGRLLQAHLSQFGFTETFSSHCLNGFFFDWFGLRIYCNTNLFVALRPHGELFPTLPVYFLHNSAIPSANLLCCASIAFEPVHNAALVPHTTTFHHQWKWQ